MQQVIPPANPRGRGRGRARSGAVRRSRGRRGANNVQRQADDTDSDWEEVPADTELDLSHRFRPTRAPGIQAAIDENTSVIDTFSTLFNEDVMQKLANCINDYAQAKIALNLPARKRSMYYRWTPVTISEMYKLMAVLIAMGITKKPSIKHYWSTDAVHETQWYKSMFTRERFEAIYHSMLHASEVGSEEKEKIEPFLNSLVANFQAAFYPYEDVSIDEMVIGYKGTWKSKQYNAAKPKKYHIKTFGLCDSVTGYVYNVLMYFGKDTSYNPDLDPDSGEAVKVFEYLLRNLGPGHHVFADRYYTTKKLVDFLNTKSTHYTGTVQTNRVGFPKVIRNKTLKLQHRESKVYRNKNRDLLTVAWRDKKAKNYCVVTSTKLSGKPTEVRRRRETLQMPSLIHSYNNSMNGCDRLDQCVSYYAQFTRKTIKWWKRVFLWSLEVAQVNSFILYNLSHPNEKLSLLKFKDRLITQLCEKSVTCADYVAAECSKRGRPSYTPLHTRLSTQQHLIEHRAADRNCVICSTAQDRRRTKYACSTCDKYLHPKDCFRTYHTAVTLPNE